MNRAGRLLLQRRTGGNPLLGGVNRFTSAATTSQLFKNVNIQSQQRQQQQRQMSSYILDGLMGRRGGGGGGGASTWQWPITKPTTVFNIVPQGFRYVP